MTPRRTAALCALALATAALGACGDDADTAADPTADIVDSSPEPSPLDGADDVVGITDAGAALDSVGLEAKASAIESAMGDDEIDRIEVDGDTIHVYLKGGTFDPIMACMVTNGVLSDGEQAVMHLDGETTPCD